MPTTELFDIIVIGAGSGGLNVAGFMNKAGFRVLLIDKTAATIGGDCLNYGCVPSKALIHCARLVGQARQAAAYGLEVTGVVDWPKVVAYIQSRQAIIREHESAEWFTSQGMTVVLGEARFIDQTTVAVGERHFTASKIVIATGSRPRLLATPGVAGVTNLYTNETIFTAPTFPRRLLVVGGGPIGVEIGQAFALLGSHVTLVTPEDRVLPRELPTVSTHIATQLVKNGITLKLGHTLEAFTSGTKATARAADGSTTDIDFDAVLVAIGRIPNTERLDLPTAHVAVDERGFIKTDACLRTTNARVYACGDVAGNFQFTHAAEAHAATIIRNFFSPFKKPFDHASMAAVTYTWPEVATYGMTAAELTKQGRPFTTATTTFAEDDRAITDGYQDSFQSVYLDPRGTILGGTMVAPGAGELVQELLLAKSAGLPLRTLFKKVYPYPTATRINRRLAATLETKRLTPTVMRLLQLLYRIV